MCFFGTGLTPCVSMAPGLCSNGTGLGSLPHPDSICRSRRILSMCSLSVVSKTASMMREMKCYFSQNHGGGGFRHAPLVSFIFANKEFW